MIPISDVNTRSNGPPLVTIGVIVVNVLVFVYEQMLSNQALQLFILAYGVVPLEITTGRDLAPRIPLPIWFTLFSSMFMHGGWMHIIGNMLYLWVFGDNIEDRMGRVKFLLFYLVCGLAADAAQILNDPISRTPSLGARGGVAGVLGAYLLLYPKHRVNVLIFLGIFARMTQLPAVAVLGFWFVLQLFNGVVSIGAETGVAYWAHVGGFGAGMLIALPLALRQRNTGSASDEWNRDRWRG